jgi:hypothetical protein
MKARKFKKQLFLKVKKILKGSLNSTNFENRKFVDNAQQYFAFSPQVNFPAHNLNFH